MIQEAYIPAVVQQMADTITKKSRTTHRYVPIRSPLALSRRSSEQVINALRAMAGIHATPYFVDGERSTNYVLVDMAVLAFKRNH